MLTARKWGELWHLDALAREQRNVVLRGRETRDYSFTDWVYGSTALTPAQEPDPYRAISLDEAAAVARVALPTRREALAVAHHAPWSARRR